MAHVRTDWAHTFASAIMATSSQRTCTAARVGQLSFSWVQPQSSNELNTESLNAKKTSTIEIYIYFFYGYWMRRSNQRVWGGKERPTGANDNHLFQTLCCLYLQRFECWPMRRKSVTWTSMTQCSVTASWPSTSPSRSAAAPSEWDGEITVRSIPALSPTQVQLSS